MIGFSSATTNIMDAYSVIQERKNDVVAASIANKSGNKKRANATAIGAGAGALNAVLLTSVYKVANVFSGLKSNILVNWICSQFDKWIGRAENFFPMANKSMQRTLGILGKGMYGIAAGAVTGFALDIMNKYIKTKANGKVSNIRQGYLKDSWLLSGVKSLSQTKKGKAILSETLTPTKKGVLVKLKGVNRQYEISNAEIKQAYKEYITLTDGDFVKGYRKNYSSGDGDVIALEIAFRKYQSDLREGNIKANIFLPQYVNQFSSDDTLSETDVSQLYYLLAGKESIEISSDDLSSKQSFFKEYAGNSANMSACFKLKPEASDGKTSLKGVLNQDFIFDSDKTYVLKGIYGKYVKIIDTRNTAIEKLVKLDSFKEKFDTITYINT